MNKKNVPNTVFLKWLYSQQGFCIPSRFIGLLEDKSSHLSYATDLPQDRYPRYPLSYRSLDDVKYLHKIGHDFASEIDVIVKLELKDVIRYLVEENDLDKFSVFLYSISYSSVDMVKWCIEELGVDARGDSDYPFRKAVSRNRKDVVLEFLKLGVDVNTGQGEALETSLLQGNFDMALFLIENGADINLVRDWVSLEVFGVENLKSKEEMTNMISILLIHKS